MELSKDSIRRCGELANAIRNFIVHINDNWKRTSIAWRLWPYDYVKEDKSLPWLGAIIPSFMHFYLQQKGVSGDKLDVASHCFSDAVAYMFGETDEERSDVMAKIQGFRKYFETAHLTGEHQLGIISLAAFLKKKREEGATKVFACGLLYAYTLGAYWAMRQIESSKAISSARQIALCLKCDQMAIMCKGAFDDFADNIELVDDGGPLSVEGENELDPDDQEENVGESEGVQDCDGFFNDDDKFDDTDPEEDPDIVRSRAKYSRNLNELIGDNHDIAFKTIDAGLKLANDIWLYIVNYRDDDGGKEIDFKGEDRKMSNVAAVVIFAYEFANGFFFKSELSDVVAVAKLSLVYRFAPKFQEVYLSVARKLSVFFAEMAEKGNATLGIPPITDYLAQNIDMTIEGPAEGLKDAVTVILKYMFNVASICLAVNINKSIGKNYTAEDMFAENFDFISVAELARILVDGSLRSLR